MHEYRIDRIRIDNALKERGNQGRVSWNMKMKHEYEKQKNRKLI